VSEDEMTIGNYQLKNCVASGNTTQIWEVSQAGSPMQLAMKLMLDEARKISAEKAVLKHEFKIGQLMTHPSFLRFHQLEMNRDHAFFVMDFFRSPSLKTHMTSDLASVQSSFKKLSEALISAFAFMHNTGWLHRDIKPDNILVNRAGEARVIDFSLSVKAKGKLGMIVSGKQKSIQGTRTYIAPETILRKPPTVQTDLYSLGITFFEIVTGHPPFAGDTPNDLLKKHLGEDVVPPSAINPNVTKDLDKVILQMLEKNPAKRYPSMQELESAMRNVRCFEEDPLDLKAKALKAAKQLEEESVDQRLNSRADADRTLKGVAAPMAQKSKRKISELFLREEEARQAALDKKKGKQAPAAATPAPPQQPMQPPMQQPMSGMPYPGYPNMPMHPGMQYPQYPGMPMPGMQQPVMQQPGMPYPGQPMPGMPSQQPEPAQPVHQQPPASNPPPAPVPQPTAPTPQPQPVQQQPPPAPPAPAPQEEPQEATLDDFLIE